MSNHHQPGAVGLASAERHPTATARPPWRDPLPVARSPLGLGILLAFPAVAGALTLLTGHILGGRRRGSTQRLEAAVVAVLCLLVPVAVAGYARADWHASPLVRGAKVVFGVALVTMTSVYAWGYRRSRADAQPRAQRLPGEGSVVQFTLLRRSGAPHRRWLHRPRVASVHLPALNAGGTVPGWRRCADPDGPVSLAEVQEDRPCRTPSNWSV